MSTDAGNGVGTQRTYAPRPDIAVRNRLKGELGRMPTKQEVQEAMSKQGAFTTKGADDADDYVGIPEAAEILGIKPNTLYGRITNKKLKAKRVRRGKQKVLLISRAELEKQSSTSPKSTRTYTRRKLAVAPTAGQSELEKAAQNRLQNHVSFAYGSCNSWLQNYALTANVPFRDLTEQVGDLLRRGGR